MELPKHPEWDCQRYICNSVFALHRGRGPELHKSVSNHLQIFPNISPGPGNCICELWSVRISPETKIPEDSGQIDKALLLILPIFCPRGVKTWGARHVLGVILVILRLWDHILGPKRPISYGIQSFFGSRETPPENA